MPSGRVHSRATSVLAGATLSVCAYYKFPLIIPAGVISGLVLSPDLDVDNGYIGLAILRGIPVIGWITAICWRLLWFPYAKIVKHRSPISHAPIIGTAIRVAPAIIAYDLWRGWQRPDLVLAWALGLAMADTLHAAMDWLSTATKVMRRR